MLKFVYLELWYVVNSFCWIAQSVVDLVAVLVVVHQLVLSAPSVFLILAVENKTDYQSAHFAVLVAIYSYRCLPFLFVAAL